MRITTPKNFLPIIACVGLAWLGGPISAAELSGAAKVIDGDTISIGETRIRLWGIDAPEREQTCQGKNGEIYECGRDAAPVLRELTRGRRVGCTERVMTNTGASWPSATPKAAK